MTATLPKEKKDVFRKGKGRPVKMFLPGTVKHPSKEEVELLRVL